MSQSLRTNASPTPGGRGDKNLRIDRYFIISSSSRNKKMIASGCSPELYSSSCEAHVQVMRCKGCYFEQFHHALQARDGRPITDASVLLATSDEC
jgi:hypothetical protein